MPSPHWAGVQRRALSRVAQTRRVLARSGSTLSLGGLTLNNGAAVNFQLGIPTATGVINITSPNAITLAGG